MNTNSEEGAQGVEEALAAGGCVKAAEQLGVNGLSAGGEDRFGRAIEKLAEEFGPEGVEREFPVAKRCGCGRLFLQRVEHGGDVCHGCAGVLEQGLKEIGAVKGVHAGESGGKTDGVKSAETVATFTFGTQEIRVVGTKEAPLFCVADICAVLELANPTMAVANHPEDEKGLSAFETVGRGVQKLVCVTEAGLYRLIFRSYKPKAAEFQRWVFHEVLPALRHTGRYAMPGRCGEALDAEGRVTTFLRVTEALVKLGAKPVTAGNAALRWLPVITAGQLLPGCEEKEQEEMERLFTAIVEREEKEVLVVDMGMLLDVARELGLLQELRRGGDRGQRVRMGMCLRKMRGAVLETERGQWELRQRHGSRMSEWVLRRVRTGV